MSKENSPLLLEAAGHREFPFLLLATLKKKSNFKRVPPGKDGGRGHEAGLVYPRLLGTCGSGRHADRPVR